MSFLFADWATKDLKALKKKLEEMYLRGIRQATFKDQTLIFSTTAELKQRIMDVASVLNEREIACGSGKGFRNKKQIRVTTKSKGF